LNFFREFKKQANGLQARSNKQYAPGGALTYWDYTNGPQWDAGIGPETAVIPANLETAQFVAKRRLFDHLKGEGTNIANMFAERKQAANMVVNSINRIAGAARDLRRGNVTGAIRRFGGDPKTARKLRGVDIANQWLELQYGWLPLLDDVFGLIEGLHHRETTRPKVFKVSGTISSQARCDVGLTWHKDQSGWSTNVFWGVKADRSIFKYMVRVFPDAALAEPAALGLTNPLVVAWEVVPWSFVVDWFLPVGAYFEQLSADHGWDFHDGCSTEFVNASQIADGTTRLTYTSNGWTYRNEASKKEMGSRYVRMNRAVLSGFPIPSAPRFKNPFSAPHVKNALALLTQVFSGGKVRR
jgi:hypothetical protein